MIALALVSFLLLHPLVTPWTVDSQACEQHGTSCPCPKICKQQQVLSLKISMCHKATGAPPQSTRIDKTANTDPSTSIKTTCPNKEDSKNKIVTPPHLLCSQFFMNSLHLIQKAPPLDISYQAPGYPSNFLHPPKSS